MVVARGSAVRLPAARRRRQLLDVALDVFATKGFHESSMDDVAEAAGVTKPVLYQHFSSKRELYLQLLSDVGRQVTEVVVAATSTAPGPRQQVEAGFAAYFRFVADHRSAFRLLFGSSGQADEEFGEVARLVEAAMAEALAPLINAEIDDEHRRLLAHSIVGLAEGASRHWVSQELDLDPDRLAARVADMAWAGLRGVRSI
jgi:AcrR family transcriptional regulator